MSVGEDTARPDPKPEHNRQHRFECDQQESRFWLAGNDFYSSPD